MYPLLTGLRVIECASFIAAPTCALYLRQFGAEVIRIDPIGGGPDFRRWPLAPNGASLYWEGLNKGKKSIAIDFTRPEGRKLVTDLITAPGANAGLLVTNFPKTGFLGHEALCKARPDLISIRVSGWSDGQSAVDYTVNAASGVPYMTGAPDAGPEPVNHILPAWDLMSGAYAAFALLAAERYRRETGCGQEVVVPLSDMALSSLGNMGQIAEVMIGGDRPRYGNALFGAFGRDFATGDGQRIMVVAITAKQWSSLLKALDLVGAVAEIEHRLNLSFARDEGLRFTHRDVLFPLFEQAIGALTLGDVASRFEAQAVCWSPYRTLGQAMREEPQFALDRPLFDDLDHPSGLRYPAPGAAATIEGMARQSVMRAPRLGEHTDQILADTLLLSSDRIEALHAAGIVAGN